VDFDKRFAVNYGCVLTGKNGKSHIKLQNGGLGESTRADGGILR